MRRRLEQFMLGRYGTDDFSKFLLALCLVLLVLNMFTRVQLLYLLALVLLIYCYFRMFSRNISARAAENQRYLDGTANMRRTLRGWKNRVVQSKDYHVYKCPSCGQKIRIPRGKGRICITCPKCRTEFEKRS